MAASDWPESTLKNAIRLFAKMKPTGSNSYSKPNLSPGRAKLSWSTKGACFFGILLILALSSCTKNAQTRPDATHERDTAAEIPELRDSLSATSTELKGVTPPKEISSHPAMQEKRSRLVDTLVGSVYVSGNEPFTRLTLALEDGRSSIFIQADSTQSQQLRKLQGRVVRIFGPIIKSGTGDYILVNEFVIVQ